MIHRFKPYVKYLVLLLVAAIPDPVRCGVPTTQSIAGEVPPGIMITQGKTEQGFPYLAGGVSSNEREILEQWGKSYNVKLSFAEKRGSYLADVKLVIEGVKGEQIIAITTDGPLFYIQLPSGSYTVKTTFNGETKQIKSLNVPKGKNVHQTITWDLGEQSEDFRQR